MTMRKQKAQGAASKHAITDNKSNGKACPLHSKCDKGSRLYIDPLPVYFCGHYSFGPCTSQLINLICNILGNMLNDLAEAIRR